MWWKGEDHFNLCVEMILFLHAMRLRKKECWGGVCQTDIQTNKDNKKKERKNNRLSQIHTKLK